MRPQVASVVGRVHPVKVMGHGEAPITATAEHGVLEKRPLPATMSLVKKVASDVAAG
jgi:hypothetical protein